THDPSYICTQTDKPPCYDLLEHTRGTKSTHTHTHSHSHSHTHPLTHTPSYTPPHATPRVFNPCSPLKPGERWIPLEGREIKRASVCVCLCVCVYVCVCVCVIVCVRTCVCE